MKERPLHAGQDPAGGLAQRLHGPRASRHPGKRGLKSVTQDFVGSSSS
jgi:hypothetical protein